MLAELLVLVYVVNTGLCFGSDQTCPERYTRISPKHTMCNKPNPNCVIYKKGVSSEDKKIILQEHNKYRSKIATGKETQAGGLPSAANMLELVWDDELARIAEKHAETCRVGHDCNECRSVDQFAVGQNLAYMWSISGQGNVKEKDWVWFTKMMYDEVAVFPKKILSSFLTSTTAEYNHFTQLIWAKSWRIGCGWVLHRLNYGNQSYYACNYGPAGNYHQHKIYEEGPACSACPENTCCGENCKKFGVKPMFPGLCKVISERKAPEAKRKGDDLLYCRFHSQSDCNITFLGEKDWKLVETVGGNWISTVLKDGEFSSIMMNTSALKTNPSDHFCFKVLFRDRMENAYGFYSIIEDIIFLDTTGKRLKFTPNMYDNKRKFVSLSSSVHMMTNETITVMINFFAPYGSRPHIVDVKEILISNGKCKTTK